jgi:hypothetical protein
MQQPARVAACICVPVCVFVLTPVRARACVRLFVCVYVGFRMRVRWCVEGLCAQMTIKSATNAIRGISTREVRSVGKPDLHMFLRSGCKLLLFGQLKP